MGEHSEATAEGIVTDLKRFYELLDELEEVETDGGEFRSEVLSGHKEIKDPQTDEHYSMPTVYGVSTVREVRVMLAGGGPTVFAVARFYEGDDSYSPSVVNLEHADGGERYCRLPLTGEKEQLLRDWLEHVGVIE